jgi:hypothetical protein
MARHLNGLVHGESYLGLTLASKASVILDPLTCGMTAFASRRHRVLSAVLRTRGVPPVLPALDRHAFREA